MGEKSDLQDRAVELGLEFQDSDTISDLKEMISAAEVAEAERDLVPVEALEAESRNLFGVPRSVFVGAVSGGFIKGPRVSRDQAAEGIQKFLNYSGGS